MGQMAVNCQNLTLGALSSHSTLSVLVGVLFKKFSLFLNTPRMSEDLLNLRGSSKSFRTFIFSRETVRVGVVVIGRV
jgi:hypothetical protein